MFCGRAESRNPAKPKAKPNKPNQTQARRGWGWGWGREDGVGMGVGVVGMRIGMGVGMGLGRVRGIRGKPKQHNRTRHKVSDDVGTPATVPAQGAKAQGQTKTN